MRIAIFLPPELTSTYILIAKMHIPYSDLEYGICDAIIINITALTESHDVKRARYRFSYKNAAQKAVK